MVAIVTDLEINSLGIARSLGRVGIPVIGFSRDRAIAGAWSRYVRVISGYNLRVNQSEFKESLLRLGEKLAEKGVIFPSSDRSVFFLSAHREDLVRYFYLPIAETSLLDQLNDKEKMAQLLDKYNIPAPQTFCLNLPEDLSKVKGKIKFPALLKPVISDKWYSPKAFNQIGWQKAFPVNDFPELEQRYGRLKLLGARLLLQEKIVGSDDSLWVVFGYLSKDKGLLGGIVGIKKRILPIHYGVGVFVETVENSRLFQRTVSFLQSIGYWGFFGVEYKYDTADGEFKFIEINTRNIYWGEMATASGVNLPLLAYQDLTGVISKPATFYFGGIRWIDFSGDFWAFRAYHREGSLSLLRWLASYLRGINVWAYFSFSDPLPFLVATFNFFLVLRKGLYRRLRRFL